MDLMIFAEKNLSDMNSYLKRAIPASIVRQKLSKKGCILFTFDDGPHPEFTPRVLDVLDEYGARGLFFIPSIRIERAPKLLSEIVNRNHGIGNHSASHTANNMLSIKGLTAEIKKCSLDIQALSGVTTKIYRPPCGIVTISLLFAAKHCQHKIMRWSVDIGEYSHMRHASSSEMAEKFLKNIHDKAIILSHDDVGTTHEVLAIVLPRLIDMGFDLKNGLASAQAD